LPTCRTLADVDKLNPDDPRPPYRQVADALTHAIDSGTYTPGAKLPPHAAVAEQYGVSVGTVKRAFADLQNAGLIVTRQGQGSYVRATPGEGGAAAGEADLRSVVAALAARVAAIERQLAERRG
jgi:GntR family transcriptional regulator